MERSALRARLTRRRFIAGAAVGVAAVAGGGGAAAALLISDGEGTSSIPANGGTGTATPSPASTPSVTATPTPTMTLEPTVTPTVAPNPWSPSLWFLERTTDAFERREFARDEAIDWPRGAFFMDTATGRMTGYRLREHQGDEAYVTAVGPRFVFANWSTTEGSTSYLLDRTSGIEWRWSQGGSLLAASDSFVVFGAGRDSDAEIGRLHVLATADMTSAAEWRMGRSFGGWTLRGGTGFAVFHNPNELHLVELANGNSLLLYTAPEQDPARPGFLRLQGVLDDAVDIMSEVYRGKPSDVGPFGDTAFLLQRVSWDGEPIAATEGPSRYLSTSPDGLYRLWETALAGRPAEGEGDWELWSAILVVDTSGREVMRVRSASIIYGDVLPSQRWLADSSGFVAMIADPDEPPVPSGPVRYAVITLAGDVEVLPSPPGDLGDWYTRPYIKGPVPSPRDTDLLSFGRLQLYSRRTRQWFSARLPDTTGPGHTSPWSARSDEMTFSSGHGGHGGLSPSALIGAPLVEIAPFERNPLMQFRVEGTGSCLNMRDRPALSAGVVSCLPEGTIVRLHPEGQLLWEGSQEPRTWAANEDGTWVMVLTREAMAGWVSSRYLRWAT